MDKKDFAMKNPKVSIIIPVYNSEKTVGKCLDSLIKQTYNDIEIICINDCSKDDSLRILKSYADKDERIVIINHTENKNAGGARNSGIKAAKAEYVCFVDNDDWMREDAFELLVAEAERTKADIITPYWIEAFSDGRLVEHSNLLVKATKKENCEYMLLNGWRMLGNLIKKDLFFEHDLFYPERTFWEDNAIGSSLLYSASTISVLPTPLYFYYISQGSSSRTFNIKKTTDRIKTTKLAYSNLLRLGLINDRNIELIHYHILQLHYFSIRMLAINGIEKKSKDLLKEVASNITTMMPNSILSKKDKVMLFTLFYPKIAFYLWQIAYKCKFLFSN